MAMTDAVARLNAALEGRYAIERELGEGGMATVYLADDLKHERKVALKVLKPELAAVVGAERFLAEIKTTANLQHPNILPLFDSGEAEGLVYYVMPFVEGESLQERIDREKQLPVDEAVRIATDVAEALQAAHEQGIVHRDIKPANILVSRGKPLIADFGIALAISAAGGGARLTETGLSVGTPFYMSPEQATGDQVVGTSTDTYALGSVLYEMLVGDPPYPGSTAQAVLGKIIAGEPVSAAKQRPSVPPNVDATVRRALEKLPADRFTSAQDFANALGDEHFRYGEAAAGVALAGAVGPWKRASMGLAILATVTSLIAGWALLRPVPPSPVERFASPFGNADQPGAAGVYAFNLSPDGSKLVFRGASEGGGGNQLWVRQWNDLDPLPVRGTESGSQPAVSPDGERLAFMQGGQIRVLSFEGGPVITLGPGLFPRWGPDGYIYAEGDSGAVRMPATGGPVEQVTRAVEGEPFNRVGDFLPGGDGALLMVDGGGITPEIRALNLRSGETRSLTAGEFPRYVESGHLVYTFEGVLMAARFDPGAMELLDSPVALVDEVSAFTISDDGKLFYSRGQTGLSEFVWMTRSGQATPVDPGWSFDSGGGNSAWSLSPDGARLAFRAQADDNDDIWIKDLDDGPLSRLTFDEGEDWSPHWSPDGDMLTFVSNRAGGGDDRDVWTKRADGTGEAELLYDHEGLIVEGFWGPDGEWLVLRGGAATAAMNTRDILALRPGVDSIALPLLAAEYDEQEPALSPDGRWLAYISNEAGSSGFEVFVRPFPDMNAGRWQVSTDGGVMPVWAHSGRELFFLDSNRALIAAQVDTDSGFQVGEKETLFTFPTGSRISTTNTLYGVAPDDQRFLMARDYGGESQESSESRFVLVNNFFEELRERVGN
jgi:serine/threonine-protein kinase